MPAPARADESDGDALGTLLLLALVPVSASLEIEAVASHERPAPRVLAHEPPRHLEHLDSDGPLRLASVAGGRFPEGVLERKQASRDAKALGEGVPETGLCDSTTPKLPTQCAPRN